jgi:hypothetical protein
MDKVPRHTRKKAHMSTHLQIAGISLRRARHWRPSIHSIAAAAAASGELGPLLESTRRRNLQA